MLRLEYILTSGAQYFDSGYIPTVNTVVEVECCEDPTGAASSTYCLFGTGTSNSDSDGTNFSFFNNVSGSTKVRTYGNYYTIPAATLSPYRRIKLQVDIQGAREIYYIQEGTPYQYASKLIPLITFEPPASPSTISKSLFFGAQNYNGTPNSYTTSRFYSITILEKNSAGQATIKKKYIPVLRGTIAGFYEKVSGTFVPSASSTAFKAGPILYPYGTIESDSADTKHTITNLFESSGQWYHQTSTGTMDSKTNPTDGTSRLFTNDGETPLFNYLNIKKTAGQSNKAIRYTTAIPLVQNHMYFSAIYANQKQDLRTIQCICISSASSSTTVSINCPTLGYLESSPIARPGEWIRHCGRNAVSTASQNYYCEFREYGPTYPRNQASSGSTTFGGDSWLSGMMMVDLTASFGAGNEPSLEWCRLNLPFFFGEISYEELVPRVKATFNGVSKWYPTYRKYKKVDGKWVLWSFDQKILANKTEDTAAIRGEVDNLKQQLIFNANQKEAVCAPSNYNYDIGKQEVCISSGGVLKKDDEGDCAYYFKGLGGIKGDFVNLDSTDFLIHWKENPENSTNNFVYASASPITYSNTTGYGAGGLTLGYTSSNKPLAYASTSNKYNWDILNGVQIAAIRTANTWYDMTFVRRGGKYYVYQNNQLVYFGPFTRELGYQSFLPSTIGRWTDSLTSGNSYYTGYIKDFYIKRKNYDLLFPYPDDGLTNRTNLLLAAPVWGTYLTQTNNPVAINNTMVEYTSGTGEKIFSCNAAGTSFIVTHEDIGNFSTGDFAILWEEYLKTVESNDTAGIILNNTSGYNVLLSYHNSGSTLLLYASSNGSSWNKVNSVSMGDKILDKWVKRAIIRKGTNIYCFQNNVLYSIIPNVDSLKIGNNSIMFGGTGWGHPANRLFRNIQIYKDSSVLKGVTLPAQPSTTVSYNSNSDLLINLPLTSCRDEGPNHFEITNNLVTFTTDKTFNGAPTAYFSGTNSCCLTFSNVINGEFGANDFTIEWWECPVDFCNNRFSSMGTINNYGGLLLGHQGTQLYAGATKNSWSIVNGATAFDVTYNTWTHWAVTRKNGVIKTYKNGQLFYTSATNTSAIYFDLASSNCSIGRYSSSMFKGYMSNFKIYRGCRYDGNFTVTAPSENS